jgi:hypothetical protein
MEKMEAKLLELQSDFIDSEAGERGKPHPLAQIPGNYSKEGVACTSVTCAGGDPV